MAKEFVIDDKYSYALIRFNEAEKFPPETTPDQYKQHIRDYCDQRGAEQTPNVTFTFEASDIRQLADEEEFDWIIEFTDKKKQATQARRAYTLNKEGVFKLPDGSVHHVAVGKVKKEQRSFKLAGVAATSASSGAAAEGSSAGPSSAAGPSDKVSDVTAGVQAMTLESLDAPITVSRFHRISVETQHGIITDTALAKLFWHRQLFKDDMPKEETEIKSFMNHDPPMFELATAKLQSLAIKVFNGQKVSGFGKVIVEGVRVPARDHSSVIEPDAQPDTAVVPNGKMVLPDDKGTERYLWADALDDHEDFKDHKIDPAKTGDEKKVIANYVKITAWPKKIYEYSISYGTVPLGWDEEGKPSSRPISRLRTKQNIIDTLRDHDPLKGKKWATDYASIFSVELLMEVQSWELGPVMYRRPDGRVDDYAPIVKIKFVQELTLPGGKEFKFPKPKEEPKKKADGKKKADPEEEDEPKDKDPDKVGRIIAAFNAFVSDYAKRTVEREDKNVHLVAPNKFIDTRAFTQLSTHPKLKKNTDKMTDEQKAEIDAIDPNKPDPPAFYPDFLAYRGFSLSCKPTENSLLLGIAPLTSAFYRPCTVNYWLEALQHNGWNEEEAMKTLTGVRCRLVHQRPRRDPNDPTNPNLEANRMKVICEFGTELATQLYRPRDHDDNNPLPGVRDFFDELMTAHPDDFKGALCVNVGLKLKLADGEEEASKVHRTSDPSSYDNYDEALWIPSNLLEIEPYQVYTSVLAKTKYSTNMVDAACKNPAQNLWWVEKRGLQFLGINPKRGTWMKDLKLGIEGELVQVTTDKRPMPKIHFAGGADKFEPLHNADWKLVDRKFMQPFVFNGLRFLRVTCQNEKLSNKGNDDDIYQLFIKQLAMHGITMTEKAMYPTAQSEEILDLLNTENDADYASGIWNRFKDISTASDFNAKNVYIVVLPSEEAGVFAAIKRAADYHGIHTICIQSKKADKGDAQIISNLCLKLAGKFAADPHHVSSLESNILNNTLILGADIGHLGGGATGTPNIACVVGTVDKHCMKMPGSMRPIPAKTDTIPHDTLRDMVVERIEAWSKVNSDPRTPHKLPANILYYRDGVSQSQYDDVLKEVDAIKAAWLQLSPKAKVSDVVKISMVVVGKRHNTRLFPQNMGQVVGKSDNGNLRAGYCVREGVTLINNSQVLDNFFLMSHTAIKGTARPAHYVVLQDDMKMMKTGGGNFLQTLTLGLCFTFVRATKGVSYCAPAYQADRLCARGEFYMRHVSRKLSTTESWWLDDMPDPKEATEDEWTDWYKDIADKVSEHSEWLGGDADQDQQQAQEVSAKDDKEVKRGNPWHPRFDRSMFYI